MEFIEWEVVNGLYVLRYGKSPKDASTEVFSKEEDFLAVLKSL